MARLTKREALRICWELWTWLAKNSDKSKDDWPGWEKYGELNLDCPCCEHCMQECDDCLLLDFWNNHIKEQNTPCPCTSTGSPFINHERSVSKGDSKEAVKNALIIAKAAKAELDKMKPLKMKKRS